MIFISILKNVFWSVRIITLICNRQNFLFTYFFFYFFISSNIMFCDSFLDNNLTPDVETTKISPDNTNENLYNNNNNKKIYILFGLSILFLGVFIYFFFDDNNNDNLKNLFDFFITNEKHNNPEFTEKELVYSSNNHEFDLTVPKGRIEGFNISYDNPNSPFYKTFWKEPVFTKLTIPIPSKEFYTITPEEIEQASKESEVRHFQKELEGFFYSGGPNEKGPYGDSNLSLDEIENLTEEECAELERQWEIQKLAK